MQALRTPDDRFADLPDFPYVPSYVEVDAGDGSGDRLRVAYIDEGSGDAGTVLMMHGEPSWSFLYRHMIRDLAGAGFRCVAPDLIGFGRSDKPASREDYTYARHVEWMRAALFDSLDLRALTFFGQDWGGLIGLRLVTENPDRFERVVIGNTGLPTGDARMTEAFLNWQRFSQEVPELPVGRIVAGMGGGDVSDPAVVAAYDAPFPDETYKEGARQFPLLVPTTPDDPAAADNRRAWEVFEKWDKPFLTTFSDGDAVTAGGHRIFQSRIPGAQGQPHVTIEGAGHFLQETKGPELARIIIEFVAATST